MAGKKDPAAAGMALTPELVALCEREEADPGPDPGYTPLTPAEFDRLSARLLDELGEDDLWVFAYGSLIWKPTFDFEEHRLATLHGWHRSFCLELTRWRGMPDQPGLMLALDAGGRCDGIAYRLPRADNADNMRKLVEREIDSREDIRTIRWVRLRTPEGPLRALVFWIGPRGEGVSRKLPLEEVARTLAQACGHGGSCAAYLYNTVTHLADFGIRDRNLWRLQELVAGEILAGAGEGN
jgi:glutathione-specific gamma-glutamylcyclotransferase